MSLSADKALTLALHELYETRTATYRALAKFHRETECGQNHEHWAECSHAVHAWGFDSWEDWQAHQTLLGEAIAITA